MPKKRKKSFAKMIATKGSGWLELRGSRWLACWRKDGEKHSKSTGETEKSKAEEWLAAKMKELNLSEERRELIREGRLATVSKELADIEEAKPAIPFPEIYRAYAESPVRRPCSESHLKQYKGYLGKLVTWTTKNYPEVIEMKHFTSAMAESYAGELAKTTEPATYNMTIVMYRAVWKTLKKQGKLTENVWEDIQKRPSDETSKRPFTSVELKRIFESTDGELRTLFILALCTGQREKDCILLQWDQVDMDHGILFFTPFKTRRYKKHVIIPMHPQLYAMLAMTAKKDRHDLVFPSLAGVYRKDPAAFSKKVSRVLTDCGIETQLKEEGKRAKALAGFHSFRHTFVTMTTEGGGTLANIRSMTGHSSDEMTLRYFHENEGGLRKTVGVIPKVIDVEYKEIPTAKPEDHGIDLTTLNPEQLKALKAELNKLLK